MKTKFFFIIISFIIFTNCSIDDINNESLPESIPAQVITEEWHLTEVSGGFLDVANQFDFNSIIWIFDDENGKISVTNTNTDKTKEAAFPSGTYQYEILTVRDKTYISIAGTEFGEITFTDDDSRITINQNQTSKGSSADLFIFNFERKIITTDVTID